MSAHLAPSPSPDVWDSEATNEDCVHPLPGREMEYESVLSFVDSRLHDLVHHNSLFVFGACGCGKTSTVLRALRSFTHRSLPSDRQPKKASPPLPSSPTAAQRRRPRTKETTSDDAHAAPLLSSLSQAVKKAKLEMSPGSSSSTSGGAGVNGLSLDASPASSAAHVLSTTGSPQSDGMTSGRSSGSNTISDGRALFLDTSSSTEDMCDEEDEPVVKRYSLDDFAARYRKLYEQRNAPTTTARGGANALQYVQAHYVNCADLDAQQLADALYSTIKSTSPRPDAASRTLLDALVALPQTARRRAAALRSHSAFSTFTTQSGAAEAGPVGKRASSSRKPTLHVIALDEVEYVRGAAARDVLSSLGSLSFSHPTQVALIFISNHRDLVHVPRALLEELPFEPYSIAQLKRIGSAVVQREVGAAAERDAAEAKAVAAKTKSKAPSRTKGPSRAKPSATTTTTACASAQALVQISPTLLEYIARKALLDYSGDVRQVMAMCRRVTFTALEDARTAAMASRATEIGANKENIAPHAKSHTAKGKAVLGTSSPKMLPSKLCAAVDAFKGSPGTRSTRSSTTVSSTRSSGAHAVTIEAGAAAASQPSAPAPHTLTLANTVSLLHGSAVETQVQKHISTMPEQQLYVLCCLVVLTLRHQRDATRASVAIGGALTSHTRANASAATASCSVTMRDVHQLYTGLMGRRHFPSMNAAGITTSVDGLADLGIITRPQRRGNEQVFTFNGTWSLDAMQTALENRGEALRSELAACGLDASENKFVTVLRELKNLAGLQVFA